MEFAFAYMRRERWRAKIQAMELLTMLGEAFSGGGNGQLSLGALSMMGFRVDNG